MKVLRRLSITKLASSLYNHLGASFVRFINQSIHNYATKSNKKQQPAEHPSFGGPLDAAGLCNGHRRGRSPRPGLHGDAGGMGDGATRRVQVEMPEGQVRLSATDLSLLAFDCYLVDGGVRTTDCYSSFKVYEWQYGQFVISYAPSTWLHSPKATCGRWCTKFHQFSV